MGKRKLSVKELQIGMYVAELDKPWLGSPFIFQGFTIETQEDIKKLQDYCEHVYIDEEQSHPIEQDDKTIRLSLKNRPKKSADTRAEGGEDITERRRRLNIQEQLQDAAKVRAKAKRYVAKMLRDVRLGESLNTEQAKEIVEELVERIYEDANALMWLTQLKNKHEYTQNHCLNVCVLALAFGAHLGYPKDHLRTIGLGAMLHDVGKMRTPDQILNKPEKLTAEEFEIIKRHTVDGYDIIKATGTVSKEVLDIVRSHHERLSGRGYPDGLKGEEIGTAVLLVAICDVYDAITSDRVYHHGIPAHEGLSAMYQLAPNDFGRELMQEFIKCVGIYPVGSLVELGSSALGIVVSNDPKNRLRPVVMLIRDADGDYYSPRRYVSLSALHTRDEDGWKWTVKRVVDAKSYGIDLQAIVAAEMLEGGTQVFHI